MCELAWYLTYSRSEGSQTHLNEPIEESQGDDDHEKYGRAVADDDERANDGEYRRDPHPDDERHVVVDGVNVAREPVEDAAGRRGVEERHRRAHHVGQHRLVQRPSGPHGLDSGQQSVRQDDKG